MNDTLLFRSATDTAQAVRRKELSSRELTEMLLARIDSVNPALNAVVELRREATLREAVAADEASYRYLVESIRRFPRPAAFARMVEVR